MAEAPSAGRQRAGQHLCVRRAPAARKGPPETAGDTSARPGLGTGPAPADQTENLPRHGALSSSSQGPVQSRGWGGGGVTGHRITGLWSF